MLPGDADYAQAKQLHWKQYDTVSPSAVAYCATAADVATCVLFAQDNGIAVAPRSGGHSPSGF
ncbi:FAD-binding protein [Kutzneria sp. CA-103260]|uniref:FAD-binding protein n=1 Tax=Kutzneria sp. CA-103260 TaxID=2802641 RepID=UPI001BA98EFB|nr:FAD-binding protein [Kutzneria sp. CA-103260]QUQ64447.1 FAD-binding oxidoreductase [Kutzneria sp. CA-103260]